MPNNSSALVIPLEDANPALLGSPALHRASRDTAQIMSNAVNAVVVKSPPHESHRLANVAGATTTSPLQHHAMATNAAGGGHAGTIPLSATSAGLLYSTAGASVELQRSLMAQQLQQSNREVEELKKELAELSSRLHSTRVQSNTQKKEQAALTHRYSTVVEKLNAAELSMQSLEDQLVQERAKRQELQANYEAAVLQQRDALWEKERLERQMQQLESRSRGGLSQQEVQCLLEDRRQYIPAVEVRRMQSEVETKHRGLVDHLVSALDSLQGGSEEGATQLFVARSGVLSAATDMETRLQCAESTLQAVQLQYTTFLESTEAKTREWMAGLLQENGELWRQLTALQGEQDVMASALRLKGGGAGSFVSLEEHRYVQRQLEVMTERLAAAQKIVESQTELLYTHEAEMKELVSTVESLQRQLQQSVADGAAEKTARAQTSEALVEADAALQKATADIQDLQEAMVENRRRTERVLAEVKKEQSTMQAEYESQLRQLSLDCTAAEDAAMAAQQSLCDKEEQLAKAERSIEEMVSQTGELKQQMLDDQNHLTTSHANELSMLRTVLEQEIETLREQLDATKASERRMTRDCEETAAKLDSLTTVVQSMELAAQEQEAERSRLHEQHAAALQQVREANAEVERLRSSLGEDSSTAQTLRRRNELLEKEKADLAAELAASTTRQTERYESLHRDWRSAEKGRASLQEELRVVRVRCGELESAAQAQQRQTNDKEYLMRENLRLHEQYHAQQKEMVGLREQIRSLQANQEDEQHLAQQLAELHRRLEELPQLRAAADAARRDAFKAKEETEMLRMERDALVKKLDNFMEEAKQSARVDGDFDRVCREASSAAQRLVKQVSTARDASSRYHVFSGSHPTARLPTGTSSTSPSPARRPGQQEEATTAKNARSSTGRRQGGGSGAVGATGTPAATPPRIVNIACPNTYADSTKRQLQHRSPVSATKTGASAAMEELRMESPPRPWR